MWPGQHRTDPEECFGIKDVGHAGVLEAHFEEVPVNVIHVCGSDVLKGMLLKLGYR